MRSAVVFNVLIEATLLGSLLILLVLLIRKLFRKQLGNRVIYFAWLLVAVRLLLPISLPSPFMNELQPAGAADAGIRPIAQQVRVRLTGAALNTAYEISRHDEGAAEKNVLYRAGVSLNRGELGSLALAVYLAGVVCVAGWMVVQNRKFQQKLRQDRVELLSGKPWKDYLDLCKRRHVKPLPVWLIDPLPSACLIGAVHPFIALPLSMPAHQMLPALTHEICHHKVRDEWCSVIRNGCCVLHWFNPLVWIAAACSRQDGELSCDDRVTAPLDSAQKLAYAQTLVAASVPKTAPSFGVLSTGMTMKGKHLKQRVRGILADRRIRTGAIVAFAVLATAALLIAFATSRQKVVTANRAVAINHVVFPSAEEARATRRDINNSMDADAYFERLLASPYVSAYGDHPLPAELVANKWYLREENGDGTRITATFSTEGIVTSLRNIGDMESKSLQNSQAPYQIGNGDDSIAEYVRAFAFEYLPDITFDAIRITADQQNANGRFVTCVTENIYTACAHEFIVRIEPKAQIVSFRLLDDEDKTVVRSSRKLISVNETPEPTFTAAPTAVPTPSLASFEALRAFVENTLISQMASRSTDEISQENTLSWLSSAEKAGLSFLDVWRAELAGQKYGSEFVFRLALSQLGPQAMWTAEQNQWVEKMMRQASGEEDAALVHQTPQQGELSQTQAIALARKALKEQYGMADASLDKATVSALFSTQVWDGWGEKQGVKLWQISFYENGSLITPAYCVAFSPTGEHLAAAKIAEGGLSARLSQMEREKGRFLRWNAEDKAEFSAQWPYLQTAFGETMDSEHAQWIAHRYAIAPQSAIAREEAEQIASGFFENVPQVTFATGFVVDDSANPYWEVCAWDENGRLQYTVHVDTDGRALMIDDTSSPEGIMILTSPRTTVTPVPETAATPAPSEIQQADAVRIALDALVDAYDLPFEQAALFVVVEPQYITDFSRNWYGLSPQKPYWWIGFRRPETEQRFYADYSVLVDARTGEVLQLRDPGNISNG